MNQVYLTCNFLLVSLYCFMYRKHYVSTEIERHSVYSQAYVICLYEHVIDFIPRIPSFIQVQCYSLQNRYRILKCIHVPADREHCKVAPRLKRTYVLHMLFCYCRVLNNWTGEKFAVPYTFFSGREHDNVHVGTTLTSTRATDTHVSIRSTHTEEIICSHGFYTCIKINTRRRQFMGNKWQQGFCVATPIFIYYPSTWRQFLSFFYHETTSCRVFGRHKLEFRMLNSLFFSDISPRFVPFLSTRTHMNYTLDIVCASDIEESYKGKQIVFRKRLC